MLVALAAVIGLRALQGAADRVRRPLVARSSSLWLVFADIVRSNIAVARSSCARARASGPPGFVEIPLELRNPVGLAVLACIITSTPGTAWAGYDSRSGVLTMHVLDLVDEDTWMRTIKGRYETRLLEIFE